MIFLGIDIGTYLGVVTTRGVFARQNVNFGGFFTLPVFFTGLLKNCLERGYDIGASSLLKVEFFQG